MSKTQKISMRLVPEDDELTGAASEMLKIKLFKEIKSVGIENITDVNVYKSTNSLALSLITSASSMAEKSNSHITLLAKSWNCPAKMFPNPSRIIESSLQ